MPRSSMEMSAQRLLQEQLQPSSLVGREGGWARMLHGTAVFAEARHEERVAQGGGGAAAAGPCHGRRKMPKSDAFLFDALFTA